MAGPTPNTNLALPQNYRLVFSTLPDMMFNCTRLSFPGVTGGEVAVPTPFQNIHLSGTSFEHDPLVAEILLNEDYSSYYELVKWIKQRTISESFDQYASQASSDQGITGDCSVQLYSSSNNKSLEFIFEDAFPLSVGGFTLDSTLEQPAPISFQAVFQYQKFSKTI